MAKTWEELSGEVASVLTRIPVDTGGGCSLEKARAIAWLIWRFDLKTTVDIGVYRGRSLFPQALAHCRATQGIVYGVDPFEKHAASQAEVPTELQSAVARWHHETDLEHIYQEVIALSAELGLQEAMTLIRLRSETAIEQFVTRRQFIDLVHVDGNHDSSLVERDLALYLPRLRRGGFLVLDDISWDSVKRATANVRETCQLVYKRVDGANDFAVFVKGRTPLRSLTAAMGLLALDSGTGLRQEVRRFARKALTWSSASKSRSPGA